MPERGESKFPQLPKSELEYRDVQMSSTGTVLDDYVTRLRQRSVIYVGFRFGCGSLERRCGNEFDTTLALSSEVGNGRHSTSSQPYRLNLESS